MDSHGQSYLLETINVQNIIIFSSRGSVIMRFSTELHEYTWGFFFARTCSHWKTSTPQDQQQRKQSMTPQIQSIIGDSVSRFSKSYSLHNASFSRKFGTAKDIKQYTCFVIWLAEKLKLLLISTVEHLCSCYSLLYHLIRAI